MANSTPLNKEDKFIYFLLGLSILLVLAIRFHLLSMPLERDEGEYAYMAKLILDGHAPYTLAFNMKLPGTYYMYALVMMIFGQTTEAIHIGLTITTVVSMLLLFFIAQNFVSKKGAFIAATTYGIMGTSWTILGQAAHATHFVNLFALLGVLTLMKLQSKDDAKICKYLLAGIYFSLASICKQSGLFFLFAGISIIIINGIKSASIKVMIKKVSLTLVGFLIPIAVMISYFLIWGDFASFKFWTIDFLLKYGNTVPLSQAPEMFFQGVRTITNGYSSEGYILLWIIALLGLPSIIISTIAKENKAILLLLVLFSFMTIIPGFYFRQHYFITLLPAIALLVAVFFETLQQIISSNLKMKKLSYISLVAFAVLLSISIQSNADYLFVRSAELSSKKIYRLNPFVESIEIGKFLQQNTSSTDKIAILGSEPQILFYANRYSASRHIYSYNLVEDQPYASTMQREMAKEIEINKPKYILYVNIDVSWLLRPTSDQFIFKWANEYLNANYKTVGIINVLPNSTSRIATKDQLVNYKTKSKELIFIYERNKKEE